MEKASKRPREYSPENEARSTTKKVRVEEGILEIQNLPNEVIIQIFKYLDLDAWKNGRLVCRKWDELLYFVALFSRFSLVISSNDTFKILCQTKSFFPLVHLQIDAKNGNDLMRTLDKLGEGVIELTLKSMEFLPSNFLSKFHKLEILSCSPHVFVEMDIPDTLKTIKLSQVTNFMDRRIVEKLQKFNQKVPKGVVVPRKISINNKPEETDLEFVKVDKVALKICKSADISAIHLSRNLEGSLEVDLSNIETFGADGFETILFEKKDAFEFYVKNIINMSSLKKFNGFCNRTGPCFFQHTPITHAGIQTFCCSFYLNYCQECCEAMQQSFPNLKTFIGEDMEEFDFSTLLQFNIKFEKIEIYENYGDSFIFFESLLQLPTENFQNLSNLTDLSIETNADSPNWKELFTEFPQLPKLENLKFYFSYFPHPNFADFRGLFVKCPNIKKLLFRHFLDLDALNLIKLLNCLPKLEDLRLAGFHKNEDFDGKELADLIAPFAQNLVYLRLNMQEYYFPGIYKSDIFTEDEEAYLKQKIPTLKSV